MKTFYAALALVLLTGNVQAQSLEPLSPKKAFAALSPEKQEAEAADVLKKPSENKEIWALGGVGFAGTRPLKYLAYLALLRRHDAAARFTELLRSSDVQTQLYALKALSLCAPATFQKVAPDFLKRTDLTLTARGCLLLTTTFGQLVYEMQPPTFPPGTVIKQAQPTGNRPPVATTQSVKR